MNESIVPPSGLACAKSPLPCFAKVLPEIKDGCVVTDVRMPEIDGLELQRRLAELEKRLPVIAMTGHGDCRATRQRAAPASARAGTLRYRGLRTLQSFKGQESQETPVL